MIILGMVEVFVGPKIKNINKKILIMHGVLSISEKNFLSRIRLNLLKFILFINAGVRKAFCNSSIAIKYLY